MVKMENNIVGRHCLICDRQMHENETYIKHETDFNMEPNSSTVSFKHIPSLVDSKLASS